MLSLVASIVLVNLTPQLPVSIRPIDPVFGPRTDINIPLTVPQHNGIVTQAEFRYIYTPRHEWLVQNATNQQISAVVSDQFYLWFTKRPSDQLIPIVRNRVGQVGGSLTAYWQFNNSPFQTTHQIGNGYLHVVQIFFTAEDRLDLQGTGSKTYLMHPTGFQGLHQNNLPSGHWGQMESTLELGIDDQLIFVMHTQ